MSRPTTDAWLMDMAYMVARRSTCRRAQVGAIIVLDKRIVSMGYVGSLPGQDHCIDVGCELPEGEQYGCVRTIHAEENAIAWAARVGIAVQGAVMYTTLSPCTKCARAIAAAGIVKVYYSEEYRRRRGIEILRDVGIHCTQLSPTFDPPAAKSMRYYGVKFAYEPGRDFLGVAEVKLPEDFGK